MFSKLIRLFTETIVIIIFCALLLYKFLSHIVRISYHKYLDKYDNLCIYVNVLIYIRSSKGYSYTF